MKQRPPEPRKEGLGQLVYPFDRGSRVGRGHVHAHADARAVGRLSLAARRGSSRSTTSSCADIRGDARALWRDGDGISVEARRVEDVRRRRAPDRRHGQERDRSTRSRAAACACTSIRERPATRWVARLDDQRRARRVDRPRRRLAVAARLAARGRRGAAARAPRGGAADARAASIRASDVARRSDVRLGHDPDRGGAHRRARRRARRPRSRALGIVASTRSPSRCYADAAPLVIGCDIDLDVLAAARDNARAARVARRDHVAARRRRDASRPTMIADIARERGREPAEPGLLLCEPAVRRAPRRARPRACSTRARRRRAGGSRAGAPGFLVGNPLLEEVFCDVLGRAADQEAAREREPARVLLSVRAVAHSCAAAHALISSKSSMIREW